MMNIKHDPQFDTKKVIEHYEQKDSVSITYVCTTDISTSDNPVDVFFRESPHPEFGNRYFGLRNHSGSVYITNADQVEELNFGMIVASLVSGCTDAQMARPRALELTCVFLALPSGVPALINT